MWRVLSQLHMTVVVMALYLNPTIISSDKIMHNIAISRGATDVAVAVAVAVAMSCSRSSAMAKIDTYVDVIHT